MTESSFDPEYGWERATVRVRFECPTSDHVFFADIPAEAQAIGPLMAPCTGVNSQSSLPHKHGAKGARVRARTTPTPCDRSCWEATGIDCRCSCGGENHGRTPAHVALQFVTGGKDVI